MRRINLGVRQFWVPQALFALALLSRVSRRVYAAWGGLSLIGGCIIPYLRMPRTLLYSTLLTMLLHRPSLAPHYLTLAIFLSTPKLAPASSPTE
jgi:hypothetical protein